jgi:hypothetical protein
MKRMFLVDLMRQPQLDSLGIRFGPSSLEDEKDGQQHHSHNPGGST